MTETTPALKRLVDTSHTASGQQMIFVATASPLQTPCADACASRARQASAVRSSSGIVTFPV